MSWESVGAVFPLIYRIIKSNYMKIGMFVAGLAKGPRTSLVGSRNPIYAGGKNPTSLFP